MAKVNMEGYEYIRLMKDSELLEELCSRIAESYTIVIPENYDKPLIQKNSWLPKTICQAILLHVADQLIENPKALRQLYDSDNTILDWENGYFTYSFSAQLNEKAIRLTDDPRIAKLFAQWEAEQKEEQ